MVARLQRDVECGTARAICALFERDDFRMVAPIVLMEAFAEDGAVFDDHATNGGIRAGQADTLRGKVQRVFHEMLIVSVHVS